MAGAELAMSLASGTGKPKGEGGSGGDQHHDCDRDGDGDGHRTALALLRCERDEARDQASALLSALDLLSKLAATDTINVDASAEAYCRWSRRQRGDRGCGRGRGEGDGWDDANANADTADRDALASAPAQVEPEEEGEEEEKKSGSEDDDNNGGGHNDSNSRGRRFRGARNNGHHDRVEGAKAGDEDYDDDDDGDGDGGPLAVLSELDSLQKRWALEQTSIPSLLASIQRLQSNLSAVRSETDAASGELRDLHHSLFESQERERRLERAAKKLYRQNIYLRERLEKKKRDKKSLVKNVKEAVSGMKLLKRREEEIELEERQVASRLRVHESMMRMGSLGRLKSRGSSVGGMGGGDNDNGNGNGGSGKEANADDSASSFMKVEHTFPPHSDEENRTRSWSHDRDNRIRCWSTDRDEQDLIMDYGSVSRSSALSSVIDLDALSVTSISESSVSTSASADDSRVATVRLEPSSSFPPPPPITPRGDGDDGNDIGDMVLRRDSSAPSVAGEDGLNWGTVRSKIGLGETLVGGGSGGGAVSRARTSSFLPVATTSTSAGQTSDQARASIGGIGISAGALGKIRGRAASADDALSWSSVRATFGAVATGRTITGVGGAGLGGGSSADSSQRDVTPSTMGQRLMAQLRSPGGQFQQKASHMYKLTFPTGRKVGLQFQKVYVGGGDSGCSLASSVGGGGGSKARDEEGGETTISFAPDGGQGHGGAPNVSPFREAAADISADLKAIGVRIDSLLLGPHTEAAAVAAARDHADSGTSNRYSNDKHPEPFSLGSGGGAPGEAVADDDDVLPDFVFLVSGYHGFNDELNVRPTIGARLVSIDGESLERGRWTFRRVRAVIEARASGGGGGGGASATSMFSMSFRNEPLTPAQKEVLDRAVFKNAERRNVSAGSSLFTVVDDDDEEDDHVHCLSGKDHGGDESDKPPLATRASALTSEPTAKANDFHSMLEGKDEPSFLKKLSLKRSDSRDAQAMSGKNTVSASGGMRLQGEDDGIHNESLASFEAATTASMSSDRKNTGSASSALAKEEASSSAEDFKSTMKAMSKKFKSLF